MEGVKRQVDELKSSISSLTFGSTSTQLLQLLNQFEKILTESTEVKVEPSAFEPDDLGLDDLDPNVFEPEDYDPVGQDPDFVKEEANDDSLSGQLQALMDEDMACEEDEDEQVKEPMNCKLCEIADAAKDTQQQYLFDTDGSISKETYSDWKALNQHVKEEHRMLSDDLVKGSCYSINGKELIHENGQVVRSVRVLAKYSVMSCPLCFIQLSLGASFTNGYLKLCFHLYIKHKQTLPSHVTLHQCPSCSYCSHSEMLLDRHVEYNHSGVKNKYNQKVSCPFCQKSVLQRFLTRHLSAIHNLTADFKTPAQQKLKCDSCTKEFSSKKNLERHVQRIHKKNKEFLCDHCSSTFYDNRSLLNHIYTQHNANPQDKPVIYCQAPGCQFSALIKDMVDHHYIVHHTASKTFICARCGKDFKSHNNLKQHEEIMHPTGGDKYQCTQCTFSTHAQQYLRRHMKIHSDVKKHQCTFAGCNYKTHFSENLKKHSKIHLPHHKLRAQAKRDHNYMKPKRKSAKQDSANVVCPSTEHSSAQPSYVSKRTHIPATDQYMSYTNSDITVAIQPPEYQQVLPADVKQEAYANKVHGGEGTGLMGEKIVDPIQNMMPLHTLSDAHQLYQCQQQFDDLTNNSNSYISL